MKRKHVLQKLILICLTVFSFKVGAQTTWFQTFQDADLMLSGVGFNNTGGSLLFNHPSGIASDGTHFMLCDRFNNRVLIWNSLPTKWDDPPDIVLGQPDMIGNNSGSGMNQLNFPGNVSVGSNGKLVVADTNNDRVLIWNTFPTQNGQPADVKIYFPAFSTSHPVDGWPWGVYTDGTKLSATSTIGSKIFFWNSIPATNNQPPDYTIALSDFGTPRNISSDGSTYFFVGDHNSKVNAPLAGTFFWNSYPTQENQPYDFYRDGWIKGVKLPDGKLIAGGSLDVKIWNQFPTDSTQFPNLMLQNNYYKNGDGVDVVYAGGRVYVNNYNGNNVQVYNSVPSSSSTLPDFAFGSSSIAINTLDSINYIQNPTLATDGNILIASSDMMRKFWIWNTVNPHSGQAPDVKIPLSNFNLDFQPRDDALYNNKFVLGGDNTVVVWNSVPLNAEAPDLVFQNNIGSFSLQEVRGISLDSTFFYVSDRDGNIGIWKGIPADANTDPFLVLDFPSYHSLTLSHSDGTYFTSTNLEGPPSIVNIFKVSDLLNRNTQPYKSITQGDFPPLNLPREGITFNGSFAFSSGNAVYLWKNIQDVPDTTKVVVLGQESLNSNYQAISKNWLSGPSSMVAYGNYLWVGEFKFSSRILRFSYGALSVEDNKMLTKKFNLVNYPNPFNLSTTINYQLKTASKVVLNIYDISGRKVAVLVNKEQKAGIYKVNFNATKLTSGVYLYRIVAGNFIQAKKMLLLK